MCDGCGMHLIPGTAFMCAVGPDCDLCQACKRKHPRGRAQPFVKVRASHRKPEGVAVVTTPITNTSAEHEHACHRCGKHAGWPLFKCCVRKDVFLCDTCEAKGEHQHAMLEISRPEHMPAAMVTVIADSRNDCRLGVCSV